MITNIAYTQKETLPLLIGFQTLSMCFHNGLDEMLHIAPE